MKNITVRCGTQSFPKQFADEATVGEVITNPSVKAVLGYGDNVRGLVHGVEQESTTIVPDGATIVVETRCNSKAV